MADYLEAYASRFDLEVEPASPSIGSRGRATCSC